MMENSKLLRPAIQVLDRLHAQLQKTFSWAIPLDSDVETKSLPVLWLETILDLVMHQLLERLKKLISARFLLFPNQLWSVTRSIQ
jgi:hypothetical protein